MSGDAPVTGMPAAMSLLAMAKSRRHPAEVTADRLRMALDRWPDAFDGQDRDAIGRLVFVLGQIAEGSS